MKRFLLMVMATLLLNTGTTLAKGNAETVVAYKCTNKSGKIGVGTGRLSIDNEYSSFLKKSVSAGEYVIFQYDNQGTEYWFKSPNCSKI